MSRVDGMPPDSVRIGMPVQARVIQEDGRALLVSEPRESAMANS